MTRALLRMAQDAAVGRDVDAVVHALDQPQEDGQAVAGRAQELQALVGQLEDVGDQPDAYDVEREAALRTAVVLVFELDQVDPAAPAGQDALDGLVGGRHAEVAEERVAGPGRDEAQLEGTHRAPG
jgi:hypothetical protein